MSRSKRARSKQRKRVAVGTLRNSPPRVPLDGEASRLGPARRRAQIAKAGIGVVAVISVGASMMLARITYAGHSKHPVRALSIPQPLYVVIRQDLLQAGILAPATAPPDASTSTS